MWFCSYPVRHRYTFFIIKHKKYEVGLILHIKTSTTYLVIVGSEGKGNGNLSTCKRINNQLWIFIGRTYAEAEAPILWPPDVKSWLFGKDPDAGKDWW